MINFFKKKPDTPSSPTPLLLSYQSVPGTPIMSSQPAVSTPWKLDTASSPLLLSYQSVPETPTISSQPAVLTPKKRKADEGASEYRRSQYFKEYEKKNRVLKFLDHWKKGNPWLAYDKDQDIMWCTVCFEFKDKLLREHPGDDMTMIHGTKAFYLQTVKRHRDRASHILMIEHKAAIEKPHATPIASGLIKQIATVDQPKYRALFNTVHCSAKHDWSFNAFKPLMELQGKNGVNIGDNYYGNTYGPKMFLKSIAEVQRITTRERIQECRFFSVMGDGSTDRSIADQEAVYIRLLVDGEPVNVFAGLHELTTGDAEGVLIALDEVLYTYLGISLDTQKQKLVNVNLDGASVNMGVNNGLGVRLQRRNGQHVVVTHCINHKLELSILDIRKEEPYINEFESVMKSVFSFYHYSAKRVRALELVAATLDVDLVHFGGIQGIRWVSSQHRALHALYTNYTATVEHLDSIAVNGSKDSAKACGLVRKLKSSKFITFLHFMLDLTNIIVPLSLTFQKNDLIVIDVLPIIETAMLSLQEMKGRPGHCVSSIVPGFEFAGVMLAHSIEPELQELHVTILDTAMTQIDKRFNALQVSPLSDFSVLDYRLWPLDTKELASYGNKNIDNLIQHFAAVLTKEEVRLIPREFPAFKIHAVKLRTSKPDMFYRNILKENPESFKNFLSLIKIMMTISLSTAVVERGFSNMNLVKTSTRTLLGNDVLNNLLEVKLNGTSTNDFNPDPSIHHWLASAKRKRHIDGHKNKDKE